ncbi:MAG: Gldg family protein [Verrucomicrobiota bacterium]|nr:Gldg family protein [Verrucomicrobiota bacterium]
MKKQSNSNWLFSIVGIFVMLVILVAVYVISSAAAVRVDLTEENLYTLSQGTKDILKKLDTPVELRFYSTQGKEMPVELKTYAQRVEDLLNEYRKAANGQLIVKKFDPQPDSDAEEAASFDGVEGQQINFGEKIYLGIAINMLDSKLALPFLDPRRERLLEYDLTRAIANVSNPKKPIIGVMSGLPVFGEFNPMAMRMGQGGQSSPWVFISELKRDFEVREVQMTSEKIDDDIQALVVVHPKNISEKTQYAIDQFVLRGGKLITFLDPYSVVDSNSSPGQNPMQAAASGGSNMEKLLKSWGLQYDPGKVVADMVFRTRINRGQRPEEAPAVLSLTGEAVNTNDVATSQIDTLLLPFSGAFSGTPAEGLTQTVLIHSSSQSQLVDRFMAQFSGEQTMKDFSSSGKELALAVRLNGKFKTAFPEGVPAGESTQDTNAPAGLKEGSKEGVVVLIADSDLLFDQFAAQVQEVFGQRLVIPRNGNLNLIQNLVEQLSGDPSLITIRSRATQNRPFTRVREMQASAEEKFRKTIADLEKNLADTQARLNQLQQNKDSGQRFILSPEQQQELEKFRKTQMEVRRELKNVRKNLRREVESLENNLKWINIAGMPLLVTFSGVALALVKRKRTAAK